MKTNILKDWRTKKGLSQIEAARLLDCSQALVSHYERAGLPQSIRKLRHISKVTKIPISKLLRSA